MWQRGGAAVEKWKGVVGGAHLILLALTLAFLGALAWLTLRGEPNAVTVGRYTVSTERSVPPEETVRARELVNVNTATAEELKQLPGIGPALAKAIVDYRAEHGPFQSAEELTNVSGIGAGKLDGIRNEITLGEEGAA